MNFKHSVVWLSIILTALFGHVVSSIFKKNCFMNHLLKYMNDEMGVERVTMVRSTSRRFYCPETIKIINEFKEKFSVADFHLNKTSNYNRLLKKTRFPLKTPRQNEILIMVIDVYQNYASFEKELRRHLVFLDYYVFQTIPNPYCLVMVISNRPISKLSYYFMMLWSEKILHVDIIEVIVKKIIKGRRRNRNGLRITNRKIISTIHQYNPFNSTHTRNTKFKNLDLFPDFLLNVHGYPLRVIHIDQLHVRCTK